MRILVMLGNLVRARKTDKSVKLGNVPYWWDFDADCGYSETWYRCRKCYVCTIPRWIPKGITK